MIRAALAWLREFAWADPHTEITVLTTTTTMVSLGNGAHEQEARRRQHERELITLERTKDRLKRHLDMLEAEVANIQMYRDRRAAHRGGPS